METAEQAGEITWKVLSVIGEIILDNLPSFMLWVFIGFVLGLFLGVLILKLAKRAGLFSRPAQSKVGRILKFTYRPVVFLSILYLTTTVFSFIGARRIVEREVYHGIDVSINYLGEALVEDEATRLLIYKRAVLILESGSYVKEWNHEMAEAAIASSNEKEGNGFLVSQITSYLFADDLEAQILEYEKAMVYLFAVKTIESSGLSDALLIEYDTFDEAVDKWLEADFDADVKGVTETVSDYICGFIHPYVFGFFFPFLIIGMIVLFLPTLHLILTKVLIKEHEEIVEGHE